MILISIDEKKRIVQVYNNKHDVDRNTSDPGEEALKCITSQAFRKLIAMSSFMIYLFYWWRNEPRGDWEMDLRNHYCHVSKMFVSRDFDSSILCGIVSYAPTWHNEGSRHNFTLYGHSMAIVWPSPVCHLQDTSHYFHSIFTLFQAIMLWTRTVSCKVQTFCFPVWWIQGLEN